MTERRGERPMPQREFFGAELRHWREAAGLTQEELGELAFCSGSLVAHFEAGRRLPSPDTARMLDKALCTGGALARMRDQLVRTQFVNYFAEVAELEAQADGIYEYAVSLVPGILQTEAYARAILSTSRPNPDAEEVDRPVVNRLKRACLLDRPRLTVWVILYESVLRAAVGGHGVMADQLRKIAHLARRKRILCQVVPFTAGAHAAMGGMMSLMSFSDAPDIAYTEGVLVGSHTDDPALVRRYWEAYDLARAVALSPDASLDLLEAAAEEHQHAQESRIARVDGRRLA